MKIQNHRLVGSQRNAIPFRKSPNHGGALTPSFLVMHYTAGRSADSSAGWLCDPRAKASAHLVIGKDGKIIQLVPFNVVAWHAGASSWNDGSKELVGMNKYSLGIELDNPGRLVRKGGRWRSLLLGRDYDDKDVLEATHKHETAPAGWYVYPQAQLDAAIEVATLLFEQYGLKDVVGHDDIAPARKADPGPAFPMDSFRARLVGRSDEEPSAPPRFFTTASLNIRLGPGTQHATVVPLPLPEGTRVEALGSEGSWRRVDVLDAVAGIQDIQGWVHGRYLRAAPSA